MPFKLDELYIMRMEIPKGYQIEEMPKPVRVLLGDGDGSYEYLYPGRMTRRYSSGAG
jgi:hypothetical protein